MSSQGLLIAGLPAKSLLASLLPLKASCWEVRKNQPLYDFVKRIPGFCLGAVGVLGGRRYLFFSDQWDFHVQCTAITCPENT